MQKGNVTTAQLITWGITILIVVFGGLSYSARAADAQIQTVKDHLADVVTDVAVQATKSDQYKEDIALINKKLDTLLIDRGYNPTMIEKAVVSKTP